MIKRMIRLISNKIILKTMVPTIHLVGTIVKLFPENDIPGFFMRKLFFNSSALQILL